MARVFNYQKTQKGPCKIWADVSIPADGDTITLNEDGEPDETENPNAFLMGLTEGGATTRITKETEDEFFDEYATPLARTVTQRRMELEAAFNEVLNIDVLEAIVAGIGTKFTETGKEGIKVGEAAESFISIACISANRHDPTKFVVSHLYQVSPSAALELVMSRQTRMSATTTFTGTPVADRDPGDTIGAFWWDVEPPEIP